MGSFSHREFEVELAINVRAGDLAWPARGEACDEAHLGMNRSYFDIRGAGWPWARGVWVIENAYIDRIAQAHDPVAEGDAVREEMNNEWDEGGDHPLYGLDLGVASTVLSLSAAGCVPFISCNAGALDTAHHAAKCPSVAFYARERTIDFLCAAARAADAGLVMNHDGTLLVYSSKITALMGFADKLYQVRGAIRAAGRPSRSLPSAP